MDGDGEPTNKTYGFFFIWLIVFYWHMIVTMNVAHTAACGVMASWFFGQDTKGVTWGSFKRAITTSFGSICFGSFFEAVIRALRYLSKMGQEKAEKDGNSTLACILACVGCILDLLGDILEYFNDYVYVRIACYGQSYIESAKETFNLFKTTGVEAIINDDLTNWPFGTGFLLCILIVSAVTGLSSNWNVVSILISILFSAIFYSQTIQVLRSYVKTLFVCWAENPSEFSLNRPEEFNQLIVAANNAGHSTAFCHVGKV